MLVSVSSAKSRVPKTAHSLSHRCTGLSCHRAAEVPQRMDSDTLAANRFASFIESLTKRTLQQMAALTHTNRSKQQRIWIRINVSVEMMFNVSSDKRRYHNHAALA